MRFLAFPNRGVNDIEFGMTADMVRERMSGNLVTGDFRAKSKGHPTDSYPDVPVFFYYDEEGHLEAIEFGSGADVLLGTVNPLNLSTSEAISFFRRLDPDLVIDDDGAASSRLGAAIWVPFMGDEEEGEHVETFLIGVPGAY